MKTKISVLLIMVMLLTGCQSVRNIIPVRKSPEIGKWRTQIQLNEAMDSMTGIDKTIVSFLAGDIALDIEIEFNEDGTFYYNVDADHLRDSISASISGAASIFTSGDISDFTDRIADALLTNTKRDLDTSHFGMYTVEETEDKDTLIITATETRSDRSGRDVLYFTLKGGSLLQLDEDGLVIMRFRKVGAMHS